MHHEVLTPFAHAVHGVVEEDDLPRLMRPLEYIAQPSLVLLDRAKTHDVRGVHDDEAQEGHIDEVASTKEILRPVGGVAELVHPAGIELTTEALLQVLVIARSCDDRDATREVSDARIPRTPIGIGRSFDLVSSKGEEINGADGAAQIVKVTLALADAGVLDVTHVDEVRSTCRVGHGEASHDWVGSLDTYGVEIALPSV